MFFILFFIKGPSKKISKQVHFYFSRSDRKRTANGTERTPNRLRTDPERSPNGSRTNPERTPNGLRTDPEQKVCEIKRYVTDHGENTVVMINAVPREAFFVRLNISTCCGASSVVAGRNFDIVQLFASWTHPCVQTISEVKFYSTNFYENFRDRR